MTSQECAMKHSEEYWVQRGVGSLKLGIEAGVFSGVRLDIH